MNYDARLVSILLVKQTHKWLSEVYTYDFNYNPEGCIHMLCFMKSCNPRYNLTLILVWNKKQQQKTTTNIATIIFISDAWEVWW